MEGYSVAEAAVMLECAEGTVKSRCSRGREAIGRALRDAGFDAEGTSGPSDSSDTSGQTNPQGGGHD